MPIYEYECRSCHARFEVKQHVVDEPVKVCPTCQGEVRRVLYPVGIVFKGSGFYTTDHARGKSSVAPGTEDGSGKPTATIPAGSKPEEKKEEKKEPAAAATGGKKTDS